MAQVKLNIKNLDIAQKIARGRLIERGLRGSSLPNGVALADKIKAATDVLQTRSEAQVEAKKEWGRTADAQNEGEKDFDTTYSSVGSDVQSETGGDEAAILATYFEVRDKATKAPLPDKILNLQATQGDEAGEIDLHWDGAREVTSYATQMTPDADPQGAKWSYGPPIAGKRSASQIKGLPSNVGYWFRAQGVNATGEGPWSDPVYKAAP